MSECCSFNVSNFAGLLLFVVQVILQLRERPDRAAKARRGLTLSLQPLKGFDYDSFLSPPSTPETQQDTGGKPQTAVALPGPALRLQAAQEKGPRREVFVWLGLQCGRHDQHFCLFYCTNFHPFGSEELFLVQDTILSGFMVFLSHLMWFLLTSVTCLPFSLWTPSSSLLSLLNSQLCKTQIPLLMRNSLLISYLQHVKKNFSTVKKCFFSRLLQDIFALKKNVLYYKSIQWLKLPLNGTSITCCST